MNSKNEKIPSYLYDFVKKKIDFSDFLETEIGCRLRWYENKISAGTACPLPDHKDTNPSFRIKFMEDSKIWIFHCLGCGAKGTVIDFCKNYYGHSTSAEAVLFLCNKFGFKTDQSVIMDGLKDVKKYVDFQKKIDSAHVVSSRQCFALLKKDYNRYNKWVAESYKKMNKALECDDLDTIESVGFEAFNKMQEKQ